MFGLSKKETVNLTNLELRLRAAVKLWFTLMSVQTHMVINVATDIEIGHTV